MVAVYDKSTGKIRKSNPNDVFVIRDFYSDDIERMIADKESQISPVFKAVLESCHADLTLTLPTAVVLDCFRYLLLLQITRTPWAKNLGVSGLDESVGSDQLMRNLAEAGFDMADEKTAREAKDSEVRLRNDARQKRRSEVWSHSLYKFLENPSEALPDVVRAVLDKGVLLAKSKSSFVLGDRGSVSTAGRGRDLDHPCSEVYFPVSPDVAVALGGTRNLIQRLTVDMDTTREINLSMMKYSDVVVGRSAALLRSLADPR